MTFEVISEDVQYVHYKRRWYGVVIWLLMNLMTSWGWLTFTTIITASADFYSVSENAVNNFSIIYMACLVAFSPVVIWMMHRTGFRFTFLFGAAGLSVGSWLRYAGARTTGPSYALTIVGQVIMGMAGAVPISLPSHYTNLWFSGNSRIAANAIMSLSNPTGGAVAQLIAPIVVKTKQDIPTLMLYISLIAMSALSILVPAKPPTPPCMPSEEEHIHPKTALMMLAKNVKFWLFFIPFTIFIGFFNAISSLLTQIMSPYGVSSDTSGYLGAAFIGVGLVTAAIATPVIDKFHAQLLSMKVAAPIIGICYLTFIWIPGQPIIAAYIVLGAIGGASFTLLPVTLEWLAKETDPVSPEVSSVLSWMVGQLLGIVFTIIMQNLKAYGDPSVPNGDMKRALIFEGVIAIACSVLPLFDWFVRKRDVLDTQFV
ncbi:putative cell surface receptor/MFS transporter [Cadophora sp. DSE1049]|nr:putative cell surface receptor/MFS transporter [Cadophora sp. DSE1049]